MEEDTNFQKGACYAQIKSIKGKGFVGTFVGQVQWFQPAFLNIWDQWRTSLPKKFLNK